MDRKKVAALIRTYNNNRDVTKTVSRCLGAGIGLIIVVVNGHDQEQRGNVAGWLESMVRSNAGRIVIFEMKTGYSWSNALNLGFAHVRHLNDDALLRGEEAPFPVVLTLSNEVLWEPGHLLAMLACLDTTDAEIIGTSFEGRKNGQIVPLAQSYEHPRNTMCLITMACYERTGCFSPVCDDFGGMEDLHFLMRAEVLGFPWKRVDLQIPLIVDKNYDQRMKEAREAAAMQKILKYEQRLVTRLTETLAKFGLLHRGPEEKKLFSQGRLVLRIS
jgi:hypothetical protein